MVNKDLIRKALFLGECGVVMGGRLTSHLKQLGDKLEDEMFFSSWRSCCHP